MNCDFILSKIETIPSRALCADGACWVKRENFRMEICVIEFPPQITFELDVKSNFH